MNFEPPRRKHSMCNVTLYGILYATDLQDASHSLFSTSQCHFTKINALCYCKWNLEHFMRCLNKKKFVDTSVSMGHLTDLHSLFFGFKSLSWFEFCIKKKNEKKKKHWEFRWVNKEGNRSEINHLVCILILPHVIELK